MAQRSTRFKGPIDPDRRAQLVTLRGSERRRRRGRTQPARCPHSWSYGLRIRTCGRCDLVEH